MIRFCPRCWREIPSELDYCPVCGRVEDKSGDLVDKYISAMRHPVPSQAALAIQVLTDFMHEIRAIPALIALLETAQDAYVLKSAVEALGKFVDPAAVPGLSRLVLCLDTPLVVRAAAVDALATLGSAEALAVLVRVARHDQSPGVRERAANQLDKAAFYPAH